MPYKDESVRVAYHKQRSREYYLKNKEKVIARTLASKKQGKEEWVKFKSTLKCTVCGFDHPAALDFHHVDPTKKENIVIDDHMPAKVMEFLLREANWQLTS